MCGQLSLWLILGPCLCQILPPSDREEIPRRTVNLHLPQLLQRIWHLYRGEGLEATTGILIPWLGQRLREAMERAVPVGQERISCHYVMTLLHGDDVVLASPEAVVLLTAALEWCLCDFDYVWE